MLRQPVWLLIICYFFGTAIAVQQRCIDDSAPQSNTMSFCTDYPGNSCCTTARDSQIGLLVNSVAASATSDCAAYLRKMFCGECDPFAEWLFNKQTAAPLSAAPWLCEDYSVGFYDACASQTLDWSQWTDGLSPFGGANPISSGYSVSQLFNKLFAAPRDFAAPGGCYNGSAASPPPDPVAATDRTGLCVERIGANSLSPAIMIVSIVDPNDGSDRLLVEYKRGDIEVWTRSTGSVIGNMLNIPNIYNTDGEAGLTSLAVHPQFVTNGRIFVHFSTQDFTYVPCTPAVDNCGTGLGCGTNGYCKGDHVSVIAEYTVPVGSSVADASSKKVLMALTQPFPIHNHGQLLFGPDGYMYLFWGDGGSTYDPLRRGQNHTTWLGKVLRIDVDSAADAGLAYHIPSDNPFFTDPSWSTRREVWAWGMRNPWRCSFEQGGSERLICGDVGQETREEVDLIEKGKDYGWSEREGTFVPLDNQNQPSANLTAPILEYDHIGLMGGSPAAIGGYVYKTAEEQCASQQYMFADWQGIAMQLNFTSNMWYRRKFFVAPDQGFYPGIGRILSMAQDSEGTIYYLASRGVYRLVARSRCGLPSVCPSEADLDPISFYATDPFGAKPTATSATTSTTSSATKTTASSVSTSSSSSGTTLVSTSTSAVSPSSASSVASSSTFTSTSTSTSTSATTLAASSTASSPTTGTPAPNIGLSASLTTTQAGTTSARASQTSAASTLSVLLAALVVTAVLVWV